MRKFTVVMSPFGVSAPLFKRIPFLSIHLGIQGLQVSRSVTATLCLWFYVVDFPSHSRIFSVAVIIHFITVGIPPVF